MATCSSLFVTETHDFSAFQHSPYPQFCSTQNWPAARTVSFDAFKRNIIKHPMASLTGWNKLDVTGQSHLSGTALPSHKQRGRYMRRYKPDRQGNLFCSVAVPNMLYRNIHKYWWNYVFWPGRFYGQTLRQITRQALTCFSAFRQPDSQLPVKSLG